MYQNLPVLLMIAACSGRATPSNEAAEVAADAPAGVMSGSAAGGLASSQQRAEVAPADVVAPSDVTLPSSSSVVPVELAPLLAVSPREVSLDRRPLVQLGASGDLPPATRKGMLVSTVHEALVFEFQQRRERELNLAGAVTLPQHLNVAIDAATPWATVAALLYSAGQARYEAHHFVVRGAGGERRAVPVELPSLGDLDRPIGLTVRVDPAGFAVVDAGGGVAGGAAAGEPPQPKAGVPLDAAALTAAARDRKAASPASEVVRLDIAPAATWAQVVVALDATRSDERGPLFPVVIFGSGVE